MWKIQTSKLWLRLGATVTGIDMGEAPLNVARIHQLESGLDVDYQQATAEQIAEQLPAHFDIVCCLEMLEHVPDPAAVIAACGEMCKPGGDLSPPNKNQTSQTHPPLSFPSQFLITTQHQSPSNVPQANFKAPAPSNFPA